MRTPPKLSDLVARRGFLIGAGVAGAGAALGTGIALPGGSGRAVAATAPPRSALMTALGRLRIAWENDLTGA
ncbi:hypothetical protein ABZV81_00220 [Streptomyces parvus]|uniref:hypothetical protein n=1 Tax=Streptomyces parvus TaxID=66428 RepID=UPI0033AF6CB8